MVKVADEVAGYAADNLLETRPPPKPKERT
jgi:hypothetical protein